jgi:hypothetical protein
MNRKLSFLGLLLGIALSFAGQLMGRPQNAEMQQTIESTGKTL